MLCPKHNTPMTMLFTSFVCDICNPPGGQAVPVVIPMTQPWWETVEYREGTTILCEDVERFLEDAYWDLIQSKPVYVEYADHNGLNMYIKFQGSILISTGATYFGDDEKYRQAIYKSRHHLARYMMTNYTPTPNPNA